MSQKINITTWGNPKTKTITLPSGQEVVVIDNKLLPLMGLNITPVGLINAAVKGGKHADPTPAQIGEAARALRKTVDVVCQIVVSPHILMEGEPLEGEVLFSHIPDDDIRALISYVQRGDQAEFLAPFRPERGSADPRPGGEAVRDAAVEDSGH